MNFFLLLELNCMRFNKWTAMRICKCCYTSFIPTETQRKRHDTSYCTRCSEKIQGE